jgi:hypothetical protein
MSFSGVSFEMYDKKDLLPTHYFNYIICAVEKLAEQQLEKKPNILINNPFDASFLLPISLPELFLGQKICLTY